MTKSMGELLRLLVASTETGQVEWRRDESTEQYSARLASGTIVVDRDLESRAAELEDGLAAVRLRVFAATGTLVEVEVFQQASPLRDLADELVKQARRSAAGTHTVIAGMVAELQSSIHEAATLKEAIDDRRTAN
ncbi:MAG: hypothetical protein ACLFP4_15945 [Spirochaetales bacterium]